MRLLAFIFVPASMLVVLAARSAPALSVASTPSVTVADEMRKIRPTDGPGPSSIASVAAAQNEFVSFQLIIAGPATSVSVSPPTLVGAAGSSIPADDVRLFREAYINVTTPSNLESGGTGLWPDPLIPDRDDIFNEKRNAFPLDVPAGENRVVWVEVHVPESQTAGTYSGAATITGTGLGSVGVPVTLVVWNFKLPSTSSLPSTFFMGWDPLMGDRDSNG